MATVLYAVAANNHIAAVTSTPSSPKSSIRLPWTKIPVAADGDAVPVIVEVVVHKGHALGAGAESAVMGLNNPILRAPSAGVIHGRK